MCVAMWGASNLVMKDVVRADEMPPAEQQGL